MKRLLLCVVLLVGMSVASAAELYTNVYVVPPTFLNVGSNGEASAPADPFAAPVDLPKRPTPKEVLERAGITFGTGMSAIYNPSTSQLIVRNTKDQMELVEAYIDSIVNHVEKQIYVTFRELTFDAGTVAKWAASETPIAPKIFELSSPRFPKGGWSGNLPSKKALLETLSSPPRKIEAQNGGISGVFTDPQFQLLIRALKSEGVDTAAPPSVMCRSGQAGYSQLGQNRYGVVPLVGADEYTIDLSLYIPKPGGTLEGEGQIPPSFNPQVTIWDGQIVAITEKNEDGSGRIIFVKAQIMDPAGMPINKKPEAKAPSKPIELTEEEKGAVTKADEAALRGAQLLAAENSKEAAKNYKAAIELLPVHPITAQRRTAYLKQLDTALERVAKDTTELPANKHTVHIVRKGESIYQIAKRQGLSVEQLKKFNRLDSDVLAVGQLLRFPDDKPVGNELLPNRDVENLLKKTIIPKIDFDDVPLAEALAHVMGEMERLSVGEKPSAALPKIVIANAEEVSDTKITLRLNNAPAVEAFRYITALAQQRFRIEGDAIHIESPEN